MKMKVSEWGNSHGIRVTSSMLKHLNVSTGDDLEFSLTDKGIEIIKNARSEDYVNETAQEVISEIIKSSDPVRNVDDPYSESNVGYLVITIEPCKPILREVPLETKGAFRTLTDAKEAARQVIQCAIADAKQSLTDLRQIGVEKIIYLAL